jgi:chromosome partitioning protein
MAKRLSVINFKGGVGKTTLALHLGTYLARRNAHADRVLLVDVDHQSSLSIVALDPGPWETAYKAGQTVNPIFSSYTIQSAQMPGEEIIRQRPFGDDYPNIDIVPSQFELDDTEIDLAATNIGNPLMSEWKKRTLLAQWITSAGVDDTYDFILFDCPPATKLVSQNAIAASHAYVVPVIPDAVSTRGVTHFVQLISNRIDTRLKAYAAAVSDEQVPAAYEPDTLLAGIVISMAQTHGAAYSGFINEHSNGMAALRRQWGNAVLTNIIERATGVAESLGAGWPVFDQNWNVNVSGRGLPAMFDAVCQEMVTRLGW